jgi:hypothetical protein
MSLISGHTYRLFQDYFKKQRGGRESSVIVSVSDGHQKRLMGWLPLLVAALLGATLWVGRRHYIRSWFELGPVHETLAKSSSPGALDGATRPVRVILVDGLSERIARELPALTRICRAGLTLRVNVGFPSVSLPVQHALWTGAWQNRSGVMFQVKQMPRPVFESLPELVTRRGAGAVAVAESHREIVASFPFSSVRAPDGKQAMTERELQRVALEAARSDAALVMVHTLAVDEAGHDWGAADPRYRQAAARSDRLLAKLWSERRPDWTVLALSDHGHLDAGGHGGIEPEVQWIRACLAGPGIEAGSSGVANIVDLNRVLAARLNVAAPASSQGRALEQLVGASSAPPQPDLFHPGAMTLLGTIASLLLVVLAILCWRPADRGDNRRQVLLSLPWGIALSLLLLLSTLGPPSLSRVYVYRIWHGPLLGCAIPALLAPGLQLWLSRRRGPPPVQVIWTQLLLALVPPVAAVSLSGWPLNAPPLVPLLSAWASTLLPLSALSLLSLAASAAVLRLVRFFAPAQRSS